MNGNKKDNINKNFERMLDISHDEFDKLDFDEQQRSISDYHEKHSVKNSKDTLVMIGGGDESLVMRVPKGKRVLTPNGYFIAGETLEENKKRWEQKAEETDKKFKKLNNRLQNEESKSQKLDFKTWLLLYIKHVIRIAHPPVVKVENKKAMNVKDSKKNEVYVFRNYEEYKNYFLMYLDNIEEELIDLAIYTRGKNGQIVAFRNLCEHIIVKKKINDFYNSITQEQIDEIHAKGKITPLEAVQMWESFDLCIEGSKTILSKSRCKYFEQNCHECLMEFASHKLEHDPIDFELSNSIKEEQESGKKLIYQSHEDSVDKDGVVERDKYFSDGEETAK